MERPIDVFIVQLPSPPRKNVFREWSGGMGTAQPCEREHHGHDPEFYDVPYFQFLYIARGLEQRGVSRRYLDYQATERFEFGELERALREERPKALVTVVSLPSLESDIELLGRIRAVLPTLRIVLIGPAAKFAAERLLGEGIADLIATSNEELAVPEMLAQLTAGEELVPESCLLLKEDQLVDAPPIHRMKDLDFIDFPAYEILDGSRYESDFFLGRHYRYMTVFSSKGCGYDCAYCPYPVGFGDRFLYRSPELVVADIARLASEFGVGQICFRDQVFTVNRKHTMKICELLIERELDVVWLCETRYDLVDGELLETMRRAGCREIHFGLETADEGLFRQLGKPGGPVSLQRFAEAIQETKEAGLRAHLHLILGLPGESWETIKNTVAFLRRTRPHTVQVAMYTPYPGTPLYEKLEAEGQVGKDRWEDYSGFQAVLPTEWMSTRELQRAKAYVEWNWDKTFWDKVKGRIGRFFGRPIEWSGT